MSYQPQFTITPALLSRVEQIAALRERILAGTVQVRWIPALQKDTRSRNTHSSTAIEGNPLTLEQVRAVEEGRMDRDDNPLKHAPHTAAVIAADDWSHGYGRELAAYPLKSLRHGKYWVPVGRADNVYGDRNLFCSCVPVEE